jgi:hypothetical protein
VCSLCTFSSLLLSCNPLQGCQSVAWHEVMCQTAVQCVDRDLLTLSFVSSCASRISAPARVVALLLRLPGHQLPHRAKMALQFTQGFCQHAVVRSVGVSWCVVQQCVSGPKEAASKSAVWLYLCVEDLPCSLCRGAATPGSRAALASAQPE